MAEAPRRFPTLVDRFKLSLAGFKPSAAETQEVYEMIRRKLPPRAPVAVKPPRKQQPKGAEASSSKVNVSNSVKNPALQNLTHAGKHNSPSKKNGGPVVTSQGNPSQPAAEITELEKRFLEHVEKTVEKALEENFEKFEKKLQESFFEHIFGKDYDASMSVKPKDYNNAFDHISWYEKMYKDGFLERGGRELKNLEYLELMAQYLVEDKMKKPKDGEPGTTFVFMEHDRLEDEGTAEELEELFKNGGLKVMNMYAKDKWWTLTAESLREYDVVFLSYQKLYQSSISFKMIACQFYKGQLWMKKNEGSLKFRRLILMDGSGFTSEKTSLTQKFLKKFEKEFIWMEATAIYTRKFSLPKAFGIMKHGIQPSLWKSWFNYDGTKHHPKNPDDAIRIREILASVVYLEEKK